MLSSNFLSEPQDLFNTLEDILTLVKKLGADSAEAFIGEAIAFDTQARQGKIIDTSHSEVRQLGLRVFIGKRNAEIGIGVDSLKDKEEFAARVIAMAQASPEDPYCGLAERTAARTEIKDIDVYDKTLPSVEALNRQALETEAVALGHAGITNTEGAGAAWQASQNIHLTSLGFQGVEKETSHHLSCSVLAEKDGAMERDYEFFSAHFAEDIPSPNEVGDSAARRTLARCGASKPRSTTATVMYEPRVARSLLGHFAAAISGAAIARQTSFLKDAMGKQIFSPHIKITDDPHRKRGQRSQAFDSEGVLGAKRDIIEAGVLQSWLLDSPSARQLGLASTGHAASGAPSPSNFYLTSDQAPNPEALLSSIDEGLYVTELIGSGVNQVTGDYSRGASGFWIKNGKIAYPVSEITIVGNLKEMFARLQVADDLTFRYGIDAPTLYIEQMTIAGT